MEGVIEVPWATVYILRGIGVLMHLVHFRLEITHDISDFFFFDLWVRDQ